MPRIHVGIDVAKFKHTCFIVSSKGEVLREGFDSGNGREGFDLLTKTIAALGGTDEIDKRHPMHSALKQAIHKIYGFSSDNAGIRHENDRDPVEPGFEEAKFVLVTSSAVVNYLIEFLPPKPSGNHPR